MSKIECSIIKLNNDHNRAFFDCGDIQLNHYLQKLASQHTKANINRVFVAVTLDCPEKILGFYSLSAGNIVLGDLPEKLKKKLPNYPVPIVRIGRLAIDKSVQKQGLGKYLLMDALCRCRYQAKELGIFGVIVDAKHQDAKNFYLKCGFNELSNTPLTLMISIKDVASII